MAAVTDPQRRNLHRLLNALHIESHDDRVNTLTAILTVRIESSKHLTDEQAGKAINALQWAVDLRDPAERLAQVDIWTRPSEDPWKEDAA